MNFLAHAYLSFRQPELLVGNLVSDFVKGRAKFNFPPGILQGIDLHRAIDNYTDQHALNLRAKKVFKPAVGLYAGAFLDIVYDHYLANDPLVFPGESLQHFSQWTYTTIGEYANWFPERFAMIYPYMKKQDWFSNYSQRSGIARSMEGLVHRAKFLDSSAEVFEAFEKEYEWLENCYQRFFPELLLFVNDYYRQHLGRR